MQLSKITKIKSGCCYGFEHYDKNVSECRDLVSVELFLKRKRNNSFYGSIWQCKRLEDFETALAPDTPSVPVSLVCRFLSRFHSCYCDFMET